MRQECRSGHGCLWSPWNNRKNDRVPASLSISKNVNYGTNFPAAMMLMPEVYLLHGINCCGVEEYGQGYGKGSAVCPIGMA